MPFLKELGPAVHLTRWASWHVAQRWLLPQTTARAFVMLHLGPQLVYVQKTKGCLLLDELAKLSAAFPSPDAAAASAPSAAGGANQPFRAEHVSREGEGAGCEGQVQEHPAHLHFDQPECPTRQRSQMHLVCTPAYD